MSSGALFGSNATRGASKNLVEFKAGKMTVKGKMVYPDPRKGLLYVFQSDDSLMHFCWKDRTSGVVEDDLIIFPDDCEFKHVPQCKTGRVYHLRFKSSSRKFLFWLQDLKTDKDEEYSRKINEVLNNPPTPPTPRIGGGTPDGDLQNLLNNMSQQQLMQLFGGVGQIGGLSSLLGTMTRPSTGQSSTRASTNSSSTPMTTSATRPPAAQTPAPAAITETPRPSSNSRSSTRTAPASTPAVGSTPNNPIQLSDLQSFLSGIPTPAGTEPPVVQRGVASELTSSIPGAIAPTDKLESEMSAHLPVGDSLCTTLSSPQFSQALSMFWSALQSGQAGPVVRQFGLGNEAVAAAATGNLEEFVTALETEAKTTGQTQQQQKQDDKSKKQPPQGGGGNSSGKKDDDDDDEGMALD
ncbi:proteasomal ubiquitin receptor ADRM1 homolog isoform X1 [Neodiprion virginianus]|uniref:proteasomal ubiquitin receptor ADRM1 homolog isoform X1 n=1 Tax=Neodiprion fabricii TaxID=2872261 RepID=UPI001ED8E281|nr:proteasomal ubiquitin receptor ADRM1 homolog isoform X1 [Neodiprion fabricii]XP_046622440.1 proteasomal ubiquitin receptor ADRM1 homolog isoform X1 [Neodiprion virginianus]